MDNIIQPNESFNFSTLSLAHPTGIQGGAYFTKIEHNSKPLYIQTCKSLTRQGFVKTGKKYYCDLMFDKNAEGLINWFENLEEKCKKMIYDKKDTWFQNALEESDIDTAFNPVIRIYKSGKFYLVRTNLKHNHVTNLPSIKIYDENEVPLKMEDITSNTNIISILEIQGIKFTSRNFQIEIELKQIMVLDNEPIFESCLIKTNKNSKQNNTIDKVIEIKNNMDNLDNIDNTDNLDNKDNLNNPDNIVNLDKTNTLELFNELLENNDTKNIEHMELELEIEDLDIKTEEKENTDDLKEVDIATNLDNSDNSNNSDILQLKKPNQVYFELYKEARNKAKVAKKNAILAYLEAKNIKKTYMLENINDSDSDFDAEIDEVSESELDAF